MKKQKTDMNGITLIALIITIIILLILAGISIVTLTGNNGILNKANISKIENRGATVEERKNLWKANQTADTIIKNTKLEELSKLLEDLQKENLITIEEKNLIEEEGEITIGSKTIVFEKFTTIDKIASKVEQSKDNDGNINYEKLKESLENIKNIQGIPSDLSQDNFPFVVKVNDELIQIDSDGNVRSC